MRFPIFLFALAAFGCNLIEDALAAGAAPVSGQDASGTIAVTSTYQAVRSTEPNRSGCTIQNNGTHAMSVRFAGVTVWSLPAGQAISCNNGAIVVDDKVEITGTSGDAYTASFQ